MPFLGNKPTNNFTSFEKQDITGDGSSSYTLAHAVNNEKDIDLFINFIHQEPTTAYQAAGTTLTLTESISSSDDCYILFRSRAIQSATTPDGSVTSAKLATAFPSASLDMNGTELILDADGDTSITADTDDQIDVKVGGTDRAVFLANNMHLIGGNVARVQLSSSGTGTTPNTGNNNVHIEGNDDHLVLNSAGNGNILFQENGTERMRIDSGGVIHVKSGNLEINSQSTASSGSIDEISFRKAHTSGAGVAEYDMAELKSFTANGYSGGLDIFTGKSTGGGSYASTFAARFDASQNFFVGATAEFIDANDSSTDYGVQLHPDGIVMVARWDGIPMIVNRNASDGTLVQLRQAASSEGTISVSGSTVSYNGFSGLHESSGIASNTPVGTVCSTIDELDTYPDKQEAPDGTSKDHPKKGQNRADHAKVKVSDSSGDKRIYGVLQRFDNNKPMIASVGIGSIRVTGACSGGDLLESNGDGTAKVQSDDIVKSKTIGKVTIGNSSTDVKLVSCVLYCG